MIDEELDKNELAFLNELRRYENKWVAIWESEDSERVVGSGADAIDAMRDAETKGFNDVTLLYVRSFNIGYIP